MYVHDKINRPEQVAGIVSTKQFADKLFQGETYDARIRLYKMFCIYLKLMRERGILQPVNKALNVFTYKEVDLQQHVAQFDDFKAEMQLHFRAYTKQQNAKYKVKQAIT